MGKETVMLKKTLIGVLFTALLSTLLIAGTNFDVTKAVEQGSTTVGGIMRENTTSSTVYVDDDNTAGPWDGTVEHPYQNITQGLSHALMNETIFVYNGTYYENVVMNKTLSLIGENKHTTIIDGNRTGNVVCIKAEYVTVTGFTVQNSGPEGYGIYLYYGSSYSNVSYNIIKNNKWGIKSETGRPPVHDCNIIIGNEVLSSRYAGIELTLSDHNVIANNTISDGILLCYSENNTIYGNYVPRGGMNERYGSINLRAVSNSKVIYNNVSGGNVIRLDESDSNEIAGNSIRGGQRAIILEDSHNNAIMHNNISGSDYQAIYMITAENNTISNNTALQNDGGFYLMTMCKNNIFSNNNISYNSFNALYLDDYSDKNTFVNNTVSFSDCGIYIRNSWYNVLFHNNFINNTEQVSSTDSQNVWDSGYPSGGNYWDDYKGIDLYGGPFQDETGCDGIGDKPYVIDENNQDNYPLMEPYPDTTPPIIVVLSPENKAYATTSIPLVFTVDECTCWIGYSVDGESNVTITGNTTLTLPEGEHWIKVYANDTNGNMGCSDTITFMVDITLPTTTHDYDDKWHVTDFTITLTAVDYESGIAETYYRINDGPVKAVSVDGQPLITTEGANNTLEYWSVDNVGDEELPHKVLTGIKLDKTIPTIGIPSRIPEGDVEPGQEVRILVNVTDSLSGIKDVTLSYNLNDSAVWIDSPMTLNSTTGLYETAIQVQQAHTLVRYEITAYDNAGNHRVEDKDGEYHVYTVIPEFTSTIILLLFMIATLAVTVYKRKHSTDYRNSKQQKIYSQIIFAIGTVSLIKGEEKW